MLIGELTEFSPGQLVVVVRVGEAPTLLQRSEAVDEETPKLGNRSIHLAPHALDYRELLPRDLALVGKVEEPVSSSQDTRGLAFPLVLPEPLNRQEAFGNAGPSGNRTGVRHLQRAAGAWHLRGASRAIGNLPLLLQKTQGCDVLNELLVVQLAILVHVTEGECRLQVLEVACQESQDSHGILRHIVKHAPPQHGRADARKVVRARVPPSD
mmetsp:Transcript_158562/g.508689  ORF Transcript_158562/g.508689 Transcript_158562/m.508689 type:complete len:211 (-) Transcript_158562:914-1546(-)